jgi:hypothetical protein
MPPAQTPKPWKEYGRYGSVGIELVASIMLGYYGGHWLDAKIAGGHGYLSAVGFLIGVYAGFRVLFLTAKQIERDVERAERRDRGLDPWKKDEGDTTTRPHDSGDHDDAPRD